MNDLSFPAEIAVKLGLSESERKKSLGLFLTATLYFRSVMKLNVCFSSLPCLKEFKVALHRERENINFPNSLNKSLSRGFNNDFLMLQLCYPFLLKMI